MLKLFIANKNYSSWSLRPWLLMTELGLPFKAHLHVFGEGANWAAFRAFSPTGKVPCLQADEQVVWDSLAIAEWLAERHPGVWPLEAGARAWARCAAAEMHSGFTALRSHCPMNIEASLPDTGALIWRDQPGVRADVQRLVDMWSGLLQEHGGPLLFGEFTVADAYFAPVCMRLHTYALPVPAPIQAYVNRVRALPGVKAWIDEALAEKDFLDFEEPYRLRR